MAAGSSFKQPTRRKIGIQPATVECTPACTSNIHHLPPHILAELVSQKNFEPTQAINLEWQGITFAKLVVRKIFSPMQVVNP